MLVRLRSALVAAILLHVFDIQLRLPLLLLERLAVLAENEAAFAVGLFAMMAPRVQRQFLEGVLQTVQALPEQRGLLLVPLDRDPPVHVHPLIQLRMLHFRLVAFLLLLHHHRVLPQIRTALRPLLLRCLALCQCELLGFSDGIFFRPLLQTVLQKLLHRGGDLHMLLVGADGLEGKRALVIADLLECLDDVLLVPLGRLLGEIKAPHVLLQLGLGG